MKRLQVPKNVKVVLPDDREIAAFLTREGSSERGRARKRKNVKSLKAAYERELQSIQPTLLQKIRAVQRMQPAPPQHLENSLVVAMMERNASRSTGLLGGVIFVAGTDGTYKRKNLPKDGRAVFKPNQVPYGAFLVREDGELTYITRDGTPVSRV